MSAPRTLERATLALRVGEDDRRAAECGVWISSDYPGLALNVSTYDGKPCLELGWTVTHTRSGAALVKYLTLPQARVAIREIAQLCDWTLSPAEIQALPNRPAIARALNEILDRYAAGYRLALNVQDHLVGAERDGGRP
jgi:hypothetical protein